MGFGLSFCGVSFQYDPESEHIIFCVPQTWAKCWSSLKPTRPGYPPREKHSKEWQGQGFPAKHLLEGSARSHWSELNMTLLRKACVVTGKFNGNVLNVPPSSDLLTITDQVDFWAHRKQTDSPPQKKIINKAPSVADTGLFCVASTGKKSLASGPLTWNQKVFQDLSVRFHVRGRSGGPKRLWMSRMGCLDSGRQTVHL